MASPVQLGMMPTMSSAVSQHADGRKSSAHTVNRSHWVKFVGGQEGITTQQWGVGPQIGAVASW